MKHLTFVILTLILFSGCKKEMSAPNVSQDLLGTWYEKGGMQITIENKVFECQCIYFRERKNADGRFLDVFVGGKITNFRIMNVQVASIDLKDLEKNKSYHLLRMP